MAGQYISALELTTSSGGKTIGGAYYDSLRGVLLFTSSPNPSNINQVQPRRATSVAFTGEYASAAAVGGFPAVSFFQSLNGNLGFVRALDATGASWGPVVYPDADPRASVGMFTSLAVLSSGVPAIAYQDASLQPTGGVRFVRATDANGGGWGTPFQVASFAGGGQYVTLAVGNTVPVITYYAVQSNQLFLVRAIDAVGSNWTAPVLIDTNRGQYARAAFNTAGILHVAYVSALSAGGQIFLAIANDASASNFTIRGGPVYAEVNSLALTFVVASQTPLLVFSHVIAIEQTVALSVATTPAATAWGPVLELANATYSGETDRGLCGGCFVSNKTAGGVSVATVATIPTAMWFDQRQGYVFLRQAADAGATSLSSTVLLYDKGNFTV